MLTMILGAIAYGLIAGVIVVIMQLTIDYLLNKFREREDSVVVAADMKEMVRQAANSGARMSFDQLRALEEQAQKTPYLIAEYDEYEDEVVKTNLAQNSDGRIKNAIRSGGGTIVLQD